MVKPLHTIVFYSYKGGVGRTLTLANLARHLARQGKKVFLIDFDLEAPGLHYKFTLSETIRGGLVDLLHDFAHHGTNPAERLPGLLVQPRFMEQDQLQWPGFLPVRLLPAGNPEDLAYWQRLARLDWKEMFYGEAPWGVDFFLALKEIIREAFTPDFLLIDARTGITEMGGAALSLLADQVVCLFAHNEENRYGIRAVMRGIRATPRPPGAAPITMVPVVTRIPETTASQDKMLTELRAYFNEDTQDLASALSIARVHILHSHPPLQVLETLTIGEDDRNQDFLRHDFESLFRVLGPEEDAPGKRSALQGKNPMRWLHLSDLHMGAPGKTLWWQVHQEFKQSILAEVARRGPPDAILLTGDLTWRGQAEEFQLLDRFLDELRDWLRKPGQGDAVVIPVPGNHDLLRPQGMAAFAYTILEHVDKGRDDPHIALLLDTLWNKGDASFFTPLFANYQAWLERTILPSLRQRGISFVSSHFPGDLLVHLDLPGKMPLSVAGLNSAWLSLLGDPVKGRLELATEQLQSLLHAAPDGSSPLGFLESRAALLLMHHPLDWLSESARDRFLETIYTPDRFLACLHGHMHNNRAETATLSGGKPRYYLQGASLFGLENFGTRRESRRIGYAWGEARPDGEVRLWPLRREVSGGGEAFFQHDTSFGQEQTAGIRVRPLVMGEAPPAEAVDLAPWLRALLDRVDHIKIMGISSSVGRGRSANRYPIERLFTTLRSRVHREAIDLSPGQAEGEAGSLSLGEFVSRHPRLILEGQPGAGKSTFLHLAATMLARDVLGEPCPESTSWRRHWLGMAETGRPPVPLLLRLADMVPLLSGSEQAPDRFRLLDLLDCTTDAQGGQAWRRHWEKLLSDGEAFLLLDGLDEVDDPTLRERVFAIVQNAVRHWGKSRMLVTSRPFGVELMQGLKFHHGVIEPFAGEGVREFLDRWIACLHGLPVGQRPGGEAGRYGDLLAQAILDRPDIRKLATNPVMLTCLCVVHWNEGQLPQGRARVYLAVIRWLIAARRTIREKAVFTEPFAERSLALLAYAMMGEENGKKQATWDMADAVRAVDPIMDRDFPGLSAEDRRHKARAWLHFECLNSGIVEEVGKGRIRFWHLTFQEFLAARHLAWQEAWWPVVEARLYDSQWRETIDLFPGCLLEMGQGQVDRLLGDVLVLRGEEPSLANDARVAGIMGRLLTPMEAFHYQPPQKTAQGYREVLERALAIFTRDGAAKVPIKDRIPAAEALGRGGDPRLEGNNLIEVPGTKGWKLGKYLVTVQEYQKFVEHGGYDDPQWWKEGWAVRTDKGWSEPSGWDEQTEHPNRPITGVSWFEAMAYCRWLSGQRGETIRLPTEALWQQAATSPDGDYPWGMDDPNPELANYKMNVGAPTPVGLYPAGDGNLGHCDLAGNVWEWQRNLYKDEDATATPLDPAVTAGDTPVLRGGSWINSAEHLRSAYRNRLVAPHRNGDLGFRVAVAPASR